MRLTLDARARRLLRRLPQSAVYSGIELILLALLALQCARLIWAVVTPVDPLGAWRDGEAAAAPRAVLGAFDPFFRLSAAEGPAVVTGLNLSLYGIRQDRASGRGSAIIGLPDGSQDSFAVGEEILPGVTLAAVAFDGVTIARGSEREQIFLDQSQPATQVSVLPAPEQADLESAKIVADIHATPRRQGEEITGFVIQPRGIGTAFADAGFKPGDVMLAVNGTRITSPERLTELGEELGAGSEAIVEIERGGQVRTIRIKVAR